jgi:hypothetical protein
MLKTVKVFCFDTVLQVFILKGLTDTSSHKHPEPCSPMGLIIIVIVYRGIACKALFLNEIGEVLRHGTMYCAPTPEGRGK